MLKGEKNVCYDSNIHPFIISMAREQANKNKVTTSSQSWISSFPNMCKTKLKFSENKTEMPGRTLFDENTVFLSMVLIRRTFKILQEYRLKSTNLIWDFRLKYLTHNISHFF
jgi:hypothetical protein